MTRIAHILGRGIEGCGVTMAAVQLQRGAGGTIYADMTKKWPRGKGIIFNRVEFKSKDSWDKIANEINESCDLVVFHSVPATAMDDETTSSFVKMVKAINVRKALINHDHKMASITRNANLKEICENVDILTTHSLENDFCRWLVKNEVATPVTKMELGFDYAAHRAKYWVPIEEQDSRVWRWIGRAASWKNPKLAIDFHQHALMDSGFITILEGLEASIGYKDLLYTDVDDPSTRRIVSNYFRQEKEYGESGKHVHGTEVEHVGAYLLPPFVNEEAMYRLGKSAFGSNLYNLPAKYHCNNIEYCHAEVIASGCVPIFHKELLDSLIHKGRGDPVSKCVNTGTIGLDYGSTFHEVHDKMVFLRDNPTARDEYREMAYAFWKEHNDLSVVAASTINQLK